MYEPAEDTDLLIGALREREPDVRGRLCADVGTGSGAIAAALEARGARVVAVDISPLAARHARAHVSRVLRGDLLTALRGPFDIIAFNAPYLPSADEERVEGWLDAAFHGGDEGVEVSERFARDLRRVLAPRGRAYLVVSSRASLGRLAATLRAEGLTHEPVAATRFFFEELSVWRISPNP